GFERTGASRDPKYNCAECKRQRWHRTRNCPLYFPKQPVNKRYKWAARVEIDGHKAEIACTESNVCPRAVITPPVRQLIDILASMRVAGASPYGADLSQWPA